MDPVVTAAIIVVSGMAASLIIAATIIGVKLKHIAEAKQSVADAIREGNAIREAATEEAIARIEDRAIRAATETAQQMVIAGLDRWRAEQGSAGRFDSGEHRRVTVASDRELPDPRRGDSTGVISAAMVAQARGDDMPVGPHKELPPAYASLHGYDARAIAENRVLSRTLFNFAGYFMRSFGATEDERLFSLTTRFGEQPHTWYEAFRAWMTREFGIPLLPLLEQFPGLEHDAEYRAWAAQNQQH